MIAGLVLTAAASVKQQLPLKNGLWETTVVVTTTYPPSMRAQMSAAGQASGTAVTHKQRTCLTDATRDKFLSVSDSSDSKSCTTNSDTMDSHGAMLDMICKSPDGSTAIKTKTVFDSAEKAHTTATSVTTILSGPMKGQITADYKMTTRRVSADCGAVQPGESQDVE